MCVPATATRNALNWHGFGPSVAQLLRYLLRHKAMNYAIVQPSVAVALRG
jgi:hypothetical protein